MSFSFSLVEDMLPISIILLFSMKFKVSFVSSESKFIEFKESNISS